jgi:hypothetical protein
VHGPFPAFRRAPSTPSPRPAGAGPGVAIDQQRINARPNPGAPKTLPYGIVNRELTPIAPQVEPR